MNHGPKATADFFDECNHQWTAKLSEPTRALLEQGSLRLFLHCPDVSWSAALSARKALPVEIGAQNVHWEKSGAFTGEVSAPMCEEIGVRSALVGHSERRQLFGETLVASQKRSATLLQAGFDVTLCVGETRSEREQGNTTKVLREQLQAVIGDRAPHWAKGIENGRMVIAYEPVWAIGTGLTATPEQAQSAHRAIRAFLLEILGESASSDCLLLYGGSVTPQNLGGLLAQPDIDGALVGGASLKPQSWIELVEIAGNALSG